MTQVILKGSKLNAIAHASPTAEVVMTGLAMRERVRDFSDIYRIKITFIRSGEKIVDTDYIAFWKGLEEAGVGVIVHGRKGRPDKFQWHYSLKKIAQAAIDNIDIKVDRLDKEALKNANPGLKTKVSPVKSEFKASKILYIPLRKDFNLELNLPMDISKDELSVIANALETISA